VSSTSSSYWLWDYGQQRRVVTWAIRAGAFLVFFLAWELVGRSRELFAIFPASEVFVRMVKDLANGSLFYPAMGTLRIAFIGYGLAAVVGLLMGALVGRSKVGRWTIDPLINAGIVTPMAILVPVMAVYFGFGFRSKVFLVFMFCVFVIAINTAAGVGETPTPLVETARSFGVSRWRMYSKVVLPNSLPYVLTGLRIAIGRAVQGAIIADLLLESRNLGAFLLRAGSTFDMPGLLSGTFFIVILGAALMLGARGAERWLLRWLRV
jgi:ABC-type nitrate/sulfonate/bicarbonate transport system permease component